MNTYKIYYDADNTGMKFLETIRTDKNFNDMAEEWEQLTLNHGTIIEDNLIRVLGPKHDLFHIIEVNYYDID